MPVIEPIRVEGLREFQRALKRLDGDLPKALRVALNKAMQIVVADAKPRVPRRSGRAAGSIKAQSTQNKARIKAGGTKVPYFAWLDFGGKRAGRGGGIATRQFRQKGRYIWLSFGDKRAEVLEAVDKAIADVAAQAGLEVTRSG